VSQVYIYYYIYYWCCTTRFTTTSQAPIATIAAALTKFLKLGPRVYYYIYYYICYYICYYIYYYIYDYVAGAYCDNHGGVD
jgi:hypothetical protein